MHYFFVKPENVLERKIIVSKEEFVHRIRNVLRLKKGAEVVICDNTGQKYTCKLEKPGTSEIKFVIKKRCKPEKESKVDIHLYPALIKKSRYETILEKCTEVGVASFTPIITERTEIRLTRIPDRWHRIVRQAAEQSCRIRLPEINGITHFSEALEEISRGEDTVLLHLGGERNLSTIQEKVCGSDVLHIFCGPEGGFTKKEKDKARNNGAQMLCLGKRPLRAETASIVASAVFAFVG